MLYYHVDVFTQKAMTGNGLTVIFSEEFLEPSVMQKIAKEFKQFETIFLVKKDHNVFDARIFTVEEELAFAGHPILGAAAAIHQEWFAETNDVEILFQLQKKTVNVVSSRHNNGYQCQMNQGRAEFLGLVEPDCYEQYLRSLNLSMENISDQFPLEVVSTGLPYLLVPLVSGLNQAKVESPLLESQLSRIGAKFVYLFDVNKLEGRTWDHVGGEEDVATGSAAGPVGAYLYRRNIVPLDKEIILKQGKMLGRESEITIQMKAETGEIFVSGGVSILVRGTFRLGFHAGTE